MMMSIMSQFLALAPVRRHRPGLLGQSGTNSCEKSVWLRMFKIGLAGSGGRNSLSWPPAARYLCAARRFFEAENPAELSRARTTGVQAKHSNTYTRQAATKRHVSRVLMGTRATNGLAPPWRPAGSEPRLSAAAACQAARQRRPSSSQCRPVRPIGYNNDARPRAKAKATGDGGRRRLSCWPARKQNGTPRAGNNRTTSDWRPCDGPSSMLVAFVSAAAKDHVWLAGRKTAWRAVGRPADEMHESDSHKLTVSSAFVARRNQFRRACNRVIWRRPAGRARAPADRPRRRPK
jgi:hypothetical protein